MILNYNFFLKNVIYRHVDASTPLTWTNFDWLISFTTHQSVILLGFSVSRQFFSLGSLTKGILLVSFLFFIFRFTNFFYLFFVFVISISFTPSLSPYFFYFFRSVPFAHFFYSVSFAQFFSLHFFHYALFVLFLPVSRSKVCFLIFTFGLMVSSFVLHILFLLTFFYPFIYVCHLVFAPFLSFFHFFLSPLFVPFAPFPSLCSFHPFRMFFHFTCGFFFCSSYFAFTNFLLSFYLCLSYRFCSISFILPFLPFAPFHSFRSISFTTLFSFHFLQFHDQRYVFFSFHFWFLLLFFIFRLY